MVGRPFQRRGQPRAAVELARVAAAARPTRVRRCGVGGAGGGPGRPPRATRAGAATRAAAPRGRPRPSPSSIVTQPVVGERGQARRRRPRRARLRARRARPGGARPRRPRPRPPGAAGSARATTRWRGVEPLVGALGQPRDRAVHAAGLLVGAHAQAPAVALLPQLEQRGRQQRQRAGLALDVGDQRIDELGLDAQAGAPRGQLDRPPQLVAAHRTDGHVVGAEQTPQLGVARRSARRSRRGSATSTSARPARVARAGDERVDERRCARARRGRP